MGEEQTERLSERPTFGHFLDRSDGREAYTEFMLDTFGREDARYTEEENRTLYGIQFDRGMLDREFSSGGIDAMGYVERTRGFNEAVAAINEASFNRMEQGK